MSGANICSADGCDAPLLFSARQRGDGLCGMCSRFANGTAKAIDRARRADKKIRAMGRAKQFVRDDQHNDIVAAEVAEAEVAALRSAADICAKHHRTACRCACCIAFMCAVHEIVNLIRSKEAPK